jgi:hypothetical protein
VTSSRKGRKPATSSRDEISLHNDSVTGTTIDNVVNNPDAESRWLLEGIVIIWNRRRHAGLRLAASLFGRPLLNTR